MAAAVSAFSCLGQGAAFATTSGVTRHQVGGAVPSSFCWSGSGGSTAGLSTCRRSSFEIGLRHDDHAPALRYWCGRRGGEGGRNTQTQRQVHDNKIPLVDDEDDVQITAGGRVVPPIDAAEGGGKEMSLLGELLARGAEATKSGGATESSHTGSSEWAGFKTAPNLLEVL